MSVDGIVGDNTGNAMGFSLLPYLQLVHQMPKRTCTMKKEMYCLEWRSSRTDYLIDDAEIVETRPNEELTEQVKG